MPDITVFDSGDVRIVRVGPMGPLDNNAYIVRDVDSGAALLVDMPLEQGPLLDAIAAEGGVQTIVATHWHPDHWASYDAVRAVTSAPVLVCDREINVPSERIDRLVHDGEDLVVGTVRLTVLHTPGHTPGSISLRLGRAVISGDTLFDGGPGRTFARGDLDVLLEAIAAKLLPLPDDTVVLPGHGGETTIGESRGGYEAYRLRPQPAGHFGDVEWPKAPERSLV